MTIPNRYLNAGQWIRYVFCRVLTQFTQELGRLSVTLVLLGKGRVPVTSLGSAVTPAEASQHDASCVTTDVAEPNPALPISADKGANEDVFGCSRSHSHLLVVAEMCRRKQQ